MVLEQLSNIKAPGKVGVRIELLEAGGTALIVELLKLYNSVIHTGTTPEATGAW